MLTFKISVQQETSLRRHHSFIKKMNIHTIDFPGGSEVKASASSAGDLGSIPGSGRSPGKGNRNPLQYSCLENPVDGEV